MVFVCVLRPQISHSPRSFLCSFNFTVSAPTFAMSPPSWAIACAVMEACMMLLCLFPPLPALLALLAPPPLPARAPLDMLVTDAPTDAPPLIFLEGVFLREEVPDAIEAPLLVFLE
eukprot:CAMPEP_0196248742 /NCGR_PEP_ID=MMETSP0913-20130531/41193_1 /TAXON_ID=49265 /ORGANISM="Thalassiosira rotula, Strain GSO102" /LENGTH=115 /DNA_ID=CAMNT_0041534127 /DNA_START=553 /DNA_END=900 /DNA_ORIENTATION=-